MNTIQAVIALRDKMSPGLVSITTKLRGVQKGLDAIAGGTSSFTKVGGKAGGIFSKIFVNSKGISASFSRADMRLRGLNASLNESMGLFSGLGATIKGALGMMVGFSIGNTVIRTLQNSVQSAMDRIDTMTSFKRKMKLITGDEANGDRALEALKESTTGTPYKLTTATMGVQNFVTRGLSTDEAVDSVNTWMDAVSAYGMGTSDELQTVLDALGKMRTKGTVEMKQLNRLFNVGINPVKMYADAVGAAASDVSKALTNKEISADTFIKVVEKAMKEGIGGVTVVTGQARKAASTWKATIDNMNAAVSRGTTEVIESLDRMMKATNDLGLKVLVKGYGQVMEKALKGVAGFIDNTVTPSFQRLIKAIKKLNEMTSDFGFDFYSGIWDKFQNAEAEKPNLSFGKIDNGALSKAWSGMFVDFKTKIGPEVFEQITNILGELSDIVRAVVPPLLRLGTAFAEAFTDITGKDLPGALKIVADGLGGLGDTIERYFPDVIDKIIPYAKELLQTFLAYKGITTAASVLSSFLGLLEGGLMTYWRSADRLLLMGVAFAILKANGGDLLGVIQNLQKGFQDLAEFLKPVGDALSILSNGVIDSVANQFSRLKVGLESAFEGNGAGDQIQFVINVIKAKITDFLNQLPGWATNAVAAFDSTLGQIVDTLIEIGNYIATGEINENSSPLVRFIDTAKTKFQEFRNWVSPILSEVGSNLQTMVGPTVQLASSFWNLITSLASMVIPPAWSILSSIIQTIIEYLPEMSSLFSSTWNTVSNLLSTLVNWITQLGELIVPPVLGGIQKAMEWMANHGEAVSNAIGLVVSAFAGFKVFNTLSNWLPTAIGLIGTLRSAFQGLGVNLVYWFFKMFNVISMFKGAQGIGGLVKAFGSLMSPTGWIFLLIAAISALAVYLVYLYHTSDEFKQKWDAAWSMENGIGRGLWSLVSALSVFCKYIKLTWSGIVAGAKIVWSAVKLIWTPIQWLFKQISDVYNSTVGKVGGWIGKKIGDLFGWDMSTEKESGGQKDFLHGVGDGFDSMSKKYDNLGDSISGWIDEKNAGLKEDLLGETPVSDEVKKAALQPPESLSVDNLKKNGLSMPIDFSGFSNSLNTGVDNVKNNISGIADSFKGSLGEAADSMDTAKSNVKELGESLENALGMGRGEVIGKEFVDGFVNGLGGGLTNEDIQRIADNLREKFKPITDFFNSYKGSSLESIQKGFSDKPDTMLTQENLDKAKNKGQELWDSRHEPVLTKDRLKSAGDWIKNTVQEGHENSLEGIRNGAKTNSQTGTVKPKTVYGGKQATVKTLKPAGSTTNKNVDWDKADKLGTLQNQLTKKTVRTYKEMDKSGGYISKNLMAGMLKGLADNQSKVSKGYGDFIDNLKTQFTDGFEIHSPSRFTQYVSAMLSEGLKKGWSQRKLNIYYAKALTDIRNQIKSGAFDHMQWMRAFDQDVMIGILGYLNDVDDEEIRGKKLESLSYPIDGLVGKVVKDYGENSSIGRGANGIDIEVPKGANALALKTGKIIETYDDYLGYGKGLRIKHKNKLESVYAGLGTVLAGSGVEVMSGTPLGKIEKDNDDEATVSKLHFELYKDGKSINPKKYLDHSKKRLNANSSPYYNLRRDFRITYGSYPEDFQQLTDEKAKKKAKNDNLHIVGKSKKDPNKLTSWVSLKEDRNSRLRYSSGKGYFQKILPNIGREANGNLVNFLSKWANTLSGFNPYKTGKTKTGAAAKGLFQLTDTAFQKYGHRSGKTANIWNGEDNTYALLNVLDAFKPKFKKVESSEKGFSYKKIWNLTKLATPEFKELVDFFNQLGYSHISHPGGYTKAGYKEGYYTQNGSVPEEYKDKYGDMTSTRDGLEWIEHIIDRDKGQTFIRDMQRRATWWYYVEKGEFMKGTDWKKIIYHNPKPHPEDTFNKTEFLDHPIKRYLAFTRNAIIQGLLRGCMQKALDGNLRVPERKKWLERTKKLAEMQKVYYEKTKDGQVIPSREHATKMTNNTGLDYFLTAVRILLKRNDLDDFGYTVMDDTGLGKGRFLDSRWWAMASDYAGGKLNTEAQKSEWAKNKESFGGSMMNWMRLNDFWNNPLSWMLNNPTAKKKTRGYATGTTWARRGLHWVGEEGPELLSFRGGEKVIPHDQSVDLANAAARRRSGTAGVGTNLTGAATAGTRVNNNNTDERSYSVGNNNTFNISKEVDADQFINQFESQMHKVLSEGSRIMTGV